jgi:putative transposase
MGKPYSEDLRRSVVHAIESGHTYEETSELCGVSVSSISRFLTRWRGTGSVNPEKFGGYKGEERFIHAVLVLFQVIRFKNLL